MTSRDAAIGRLRAGVGGGGVVKLGLSELEGVCRPVGLVVGW